MTVDRFGTVTWARKNQVIGLSFPRRKLESKVTMVRKNKKYRESIRLTTSTNGGQAH
jgi:hypothetical protein